MDTRGRSEIAETTSVGPTTKRMLCKLGEHAQSCPTLYEAARLPGFSVHGNSSGKNTGVGCHSLLQGIFPTQGSNLGLLHCKQILYHLSHKGISKLKWTDIGEFNSGDHHIYYCGQESLRKNGVALIVNKDSEMQHLGAVSKTTE